MKLYEKDNSIPTKLLGNTSHVVYTNNDFIEFHTNVLIISLKYTLLPCVKPKPLDTKQGIFCLFLHNYY